MIAPLPDAVSLAAALARRELTAGELARRCLESIAARDGELHAFTHLDREGALRAAAASDERRSRGAALSRLDGLPLAIKANLAVEGWPHTGGLGFRRHELATADAFVIARLRAGGAVLLGATNMDEGALGATTINPWYGTTANPLDTRLSAGGSSGGSAAAVAAGQCAFALGTDTIGSLRIPAAWCGVAALKAGFGAISTGGAIPMHHRFDHVGPIARSVRDLALALDALLAWDPGCSVSFPVVLAPPRAPGSLARIGFGTGFDALEPDAAVVGGYNRALAALRARGHVLVPVDLARWNLTQVRRAIFALCEVEMARRHRDRLASAPQSYSQDLRAMLDFGARQGPADIERFERRIAVLQALAIATLQGLDALLLPTTPETAFALDGDPSNDSADLTCIASAAGLPALALPVHQAGVAPVGVQLLGAMGSERELLRLGAEVEAELAGAGA